jgi:hypothetical protein
MANSGNSIKDDDIRELAGTSITAAYQVLGGVFLRDAFKVWYTNKTNGDVYLSFDGTSNKKKFPPGSGRVSDEKTNDSYRKAGTQVYVKFATVPAAPTGWFAIEVEYV